MQTRVDLVSNMALTASRYSPLLRFRRTLADQIVHLRREFRLPLGFPRMSEAPGADIFDPPRYTGIGKRRDDLRSAAPQHLRDFSAMHSVEWAVNLAL